MISNQNLAINGAAITDISTAVFSKDRMIAANTSSFDYATLTNVLDFDPNKGMVLLQNSWDKQVMKKETFANSVYSKVVKDNAILNVNGQEGGRFRYKMAIETDNCLRTVEDTSDQSPDGYVGALGTTFKIVLNKKLAPFQTLTIDKAFGDYLVVADVEVEDIGSGFIHTVQLVGAENDDDKVYPAEYLQNDVVYYVGSGSFIAEFSEKLGLASLPESTNYQEVEFKLGSGQGMEAFHTGKAGSMKLQNGYTTSDTQRYLQEIQSLGGDQEMLAGVRMVTPGKTIDTVANLLEIITIKSFNENFNNSLMFMPAAKYSTSKGVIEFNEGLWRQMRRGKIFYYNKKGGLNESNLNDVGNYVFKYNDKRAEERMLNIQAGTELTKNIERIISKNATTQLNNVAPILGSDRPFSQHPVTGALDNLKMNIVQFREAYVPGIGMLTVTEDTSLNHINADVRRQGINPNGVSHTAYSGYIWDVTDQTFSNNATLPAGTEQINGLKTVNKNVYLVRPENGAVVWGRENGRYSSQSFSDIKSSNKIMAESFWIYGFGAMWMPDPSKFVSIELKNKFGL